jgi:hypothetical protein
LSFDTVVANERYIIITNTDYGKKIRILCTCRIDATLVHIIKEDRKYSEHCYKLIKS